MQIPRRRCLTLISSTIAVGIAGCANNASENDQSGPQIELTVMISGPDGEQTFFTSDGIANVGEVEDSNQTGYAVPVELTDNGTTNAVTAFNEVGAAEEPRESSITYTIQGDIEKEHTFGITPSLANAIEASDWNGQFQLQFEEQDNANTVRNALVKGQ